MLRIGQTGSEGICRTLMENLLPSLRKYYSTEAPRLIATPTFDSASDWRNFPEREVHKNPINSVLGRKAAVDFDKFRFKVLIISRVTRKFSLPSVCVRRKFVLKLTEYFLSAQL